MFFDWGTPIRNFDVFLTGAFHTILITIICFILAFIIGSLLAIARYYRKYKVTYGIATIYVEWIRNTPVLVQIFLIYFGLPQFDIFLSPIIAGVIALSINNSAYISEIIRAGIQSISKGQWESGASIGLSTIQILRLIIFPQSLRNVFPSLINQFIMVIFGTSFLAVIDVRELTQQALILNSDTFRTMEIFVVAILVYYVITIISTFVLNIINKKFFPSVNRRG